MIYDTIKIYADYDIIKDRHYWYDSNKRLEYFVDFDFPNFKHECIQNKDNYSIRKDGFGFWYLRINYYEVQIKFCAFCGIEL